MRSGSVVTRRALHLALAALAALALVGCASGGKGSRGASSLTFMSGGGAYQDAQDKAFIRPFERATGIRVYDDTTLSYAKVKTMVDAGNVTIDVIPAEGYWAVQQCGKLLLPIDRRIVNLSGIDPALMQSECAAPLLTYLSAIYFNTKSFSSGNHPTGCRDFFDTMRFPGKRAVYSGALPNALLECALVADGVAPGSLYPLDLDRAFRKIQTIKKHMVFWNTGADSAQLMTSGEVDMLLAWNGRAYAAIAQQGAKFAPAYGESFLHYDALVVPKGVRHPETAMRLVDFMMDAERQATLTTLIPYAPANQKATLTNLPARLKEFLPNTNPRLSRGRVVQDQGWWAANADEVTRRWQQMFQG
jgi:putative spermidine/putrescine transport system substrate-binding protein